MQEVGDFLDDSVRTTNETFSGPHNEPTPVAVQDFEWSAKVWSLWKRSVKMTGRVSSNYSQRLPARL